MSVRGLSRCANFLRGQRYLKARRRHGRKDVGDGHVIRARFSRLGRSAFSPPIHTDPTWRGGRQLKELVVGGVLGQQGSRGGTEAFGSILTAPSRL